MPLNSIDGFEEAEVAQDSILDFDDWITLISTVESLYNDDIDKISLAYDSFLSEFPFCYGYWKKYAEHHARLCSVENVVQVFERAVESVPYSVGVWVDYCNFSISSFEDPSDICRLFERGLSFVGKDYRCNLLWDKYIEFEYSQQHWNSLANIYLQTLKFPTKKLHQYYESFKKLVSIWEEETRVQEGSHVGLESKRESVDEIMMPAKAEISQVVSDLLDPSTRVEALQKFILIGECYYRKACDWDAKVQKLEQNIHRPYFHVKPLDDNQLQNWHQYLDLVEMEGDFDWAVKLYERCLVSCANYPEFWMRYVDFVESKGGKEIAIDALGRATTTFLKNSPEIHLFNAWVKEKNGDIDGAHAAVLQCDQDIESHFVDVVRKKSNMEKRMGNHVKASHIYEEALELAAVKRSNTLPMLYVQYARLQWMTTNSVEAAREILLNGIQRVPYSKLLLKELIHFASMHDGTKLVDLLDPLIAQALTSGSDVSGALSTKDRERISTLYLEFVDSFGSIHDIWKAWNRHLKLFPHLVRVQSSLKKSAKASAVLKMVAEGRPELLDPQFQKTSVETEKLNLVENADKNKPPLNGEAESEQGTKGLGSLELEHSDVSKWHIKDENKAPELGRLGANDIQKQQELVGQDEKPTSKDGLLLNPQDDKSPEAALRNRRSPTIDIDGISSPVNLLDKDAAETCNESSCPPTRRHGDSSPRSSPTRPLNREGSRFRHNTYSRSRSEYGSPENSADRRERSVSPRRRNSNGYSERRYHKQRSISPRRYNSRWNSDDRLRQERNQHRYSRYPDNSRDHRDNRAQNQRTVVVGNKGQSHNVQQRHVLGSAPQEPLPVQSALHSQPQINQYGDVQNAQLYNQMWQYYYQQQLLVQQQQQQQQSQVSQQPQSQPHLVPPQQPQMPIHQQNLDQQQHMPHPQNPSQVAPSQQQLLQLYYQQQQLYQQSQVPQQQTEVKAQQPPQTQEPPQVNQQQSYEYQLLQQQQYSLYLQQLHQYQQSQQQLGLVQDQKSFQKQAELPEKQQDQQMLPVLQHTEEELSSLKDDGLSEIDSIKGKHGQNQGMDQHASTSATTGQLKSLDQLPEIEGTDL